MNSFENFYEALSSQLPANTIERFDHTLVIDIDGLGVVISEIKTGESLIIFSSLCPLPKNDADRLDVCQKILKGNAFFAATSGYTLATGNSDDVILQGLIDYASLTESDAAVGLLETFCSVATGWQKKIEQPSSPSGANDKEFISQLFSNSISI